MPRRRERTQGFQVPDTLLNVLKFFLIALVWLFFIRAMRAVWVEVRKPSVPLPAGQTAVESAPAMPQSPGASSGSLLAPSITGRTVPMLRLEVVAPSDKVGTTYELSSDESVIGRAAGCAISIGDDTFVSHLHARIFTRGSEFWVEDLGSTNGSFVNSRKLISPVPLRSGDRIQIGRTTLEVEA